VVEDPIDRIERKIDRIERKINRIGTITIAMAAMQVGIVTLGFIYFIDAPLLMSATFFGIVAAGVVFSLWKPFRP
jgi:hypothetical protein